MASRFLIAAAHKSSGKTVIATGLAAAFAALGENVQTFKKGPDYIDPMWLAAASGRPCYNLDFNTMGRDELVRLFAARGPNADIALIEANKGLFDGMDVNGSDSNAEMAKLLSAPVFLVIDTTGMTRGIAPLLQGYAAFDKDVHIAGVILNKVGGARHESKLRAAVEAYCDMPVVGAVWRNPDLAIGERHLGLTTPAETGQFDAMIKSIGTIVGNSVDLSAIKTLSNVASVGLVKRPQILPRPQPDVKIGIAQDIAFGFYYPDDLEAFANAGATLVPIDTLNDTALPAIDGLFIGGGFPETQMAGLQKNAALRSDIRQAISGGLPTYAECGGLMYLCKSLCWHGETFDMVGAINGDAVMHDRPKGRGYARFTNRPDHPWGRGGETVKAHEFHYASIENLPDTSSFGRTVLRGAGIDGAQDAVIVKNLVAGFCHLRNSAENPWVSDFVNFVRSRKNPA